MRYLKFAPWAISAVAFLLVASLILGASMTVVDFYDGMDKDPTDENAQMPLPTPDTDDETFDEEESDLKSYVTNLSHALGASYVEGLFTDISEVDKEVLDGLYKKLTEAIPAAGDVTEVLLSASGVYDGENYIVVKSDTKLDGPLSVGSKTVSVAVKVDSSTDTSIKDATIKIKYEDREVDIMAFELYMGYIIKNTEDGLSSLCDENGNVLVSDMGNKIPAYKRTVSGAPVFEDDSGAYYILEEENGEFVSVVTEDILPALEYDYPDYSYKNENGEELYVKYDTGSKKYKFYNASTGKEVISNAYTAAYNFDENGYAFIRTTDGICCIVDTSGKIVLKASTSSYYYYPDKNVNQGAYVRCYYELPYISDISSIGSGRVDENGYIRVRLSLIGRSSSVYGQVVDDYETIINVNTGEFFDIPEGYTLEGYSDGVLLLSRDGRYGYYSIEGKWIAQPIYTYAAPFIQGLAVVGYEGGTLGMIDTNGDVVLPFVFSYISNVSSGLVSAYSESAGWELFELYEKHA